MNDNTTGFRQKETSTKFYWRLMADLKTAAEVGDKWALGEAHFNMVRAEIGETDDAMRRRYSQVADRDAAAFYETQIQLAEPDERRIGAQIYACKSASDSKQRRAELERLERMSTDPKFHELARRDALIFLAAPAPWPSGAVPTTAANLEYGERLNVCIETHHAAKSRGQKSPSFKQLMHLVIDPQCPEGARGRAAEFLQHHFGMDVRFDGHGWSISSVATSAYR